MNPYLSVVPPVAYGAAMPLGQPFQPSVLVSTGASARLQELRDSLAGLCLLEAQKFFETSKNTPANVLSAHELARVAQVVLAITPVPGAIDGAEPFDFSSLSNDEAEAFYRLREKARGAGRAA